MSERTCGHVGNFVNPSTGPALCTSCAADRIRDLEAEAKRLRKTMNAMAKCENIEEARKVMSIAIMASDILLPGDET